MALDTYPTLAWPLIHPQLVAAQAAFLAGDCYARRPADAGPAASAAGAIAAGAPVQFQAQLEPLLALRFAEVAASGAPAASAAASGASASSAGAEVPALVVGAVGAPASAGGGLGTTGST